MGRTWNSSFSPVPGLAEQVEKGELESEETRSLVKRYVRPIVDKGADILVLGCTHYPFVRPLIQEVAGPAVDVIDPATAVARELRRRLEQPDDWRRCRNGNRAVLDNGCGRDVRPIVGQLWGKTVEVMPL